MESDSGPGELSNNVREQEGKYKLPRVADIKTERWNVAIELP
jgi:hypothetical protein